MVSTTGGTILKAVALETLRTTSLEDRKFDTGAGRVGKVWLASECYW